MTVLRRQAERTKASARAEQEGTGGAAGGLDARAPPAGGHDAGDRDALLGQCPSGLEGQPRPPSNAAQQEERDIAAARGRASEGECSSGEGGGRRGKGRHARGQVCRRDHFMAA